MRNLTALLLLLSLCSLYLVFSAPASTDYKTQCCFDTTTMKVPKKSIVSYWRTNDDCPTTAKKAIVFKTLNVAKDISREVCVDPEASWVKGYMKAVDLKKKVTLKTKP